MVYKLIRSVCRRARPVHPDEFRGTSPGGTRSTGDIAGEVSGSCQGDLDGANDRTMDRRVFEHKVASVLKHTPLHPSKGYAPVDDDYYYEMVAIRAFEKYGIHLTVEQLGAQWLENNAGSWGSSEQTLLLLKRGVKPPDTGNPRYNKLWWTIGPQFSSDVYGTLAPGMPNVAAEMARRLTHINGYAEGADGAVFVSGMISLGFVETDTQRNRPQGRTT